MIVVIVLAVAFLLIADWPADAEPSPLSPDEIPEAS
jgi:hypothetical protein